MLSLCSSWIFELLVSLLLQHLKRRGVCRNCLPAAGMWKTLAVENSTQLETASACLLAAVLLYPRKFRELLAASPEQVQPLEPSYIFIFPKGQTQTDRETTSLEQSIKSASSSLQSKYIRKQEERLGRCHFRTSLDGALLPLSNLSAFPCRVRGRQRASLVLSLETCCLDSNLGWKERDLRRNRSV